MKTPLQPSPKNPPNGLNFVLVIIGDEILNGRTRDLNIQSTALFCRERGINLKGVHIVRDSVHEMHQILKIALEEADVVMTSGGIGPTQDDLTKSVLANYFHKAITPSKDVELIVREQYGRFNREWTPTLNFYHHFPEDFFPINNPQGLAPGLGYHFLNPQGNPQLIMSGPGVPRELKAMLDLEIFSIIQKYFPTRLSNHRDVTIRTHSIPEEKIFGEIAPDLWAKLEHFGKVASLPHTMGVDIVVSLSPSKLECEDELKSIVSQSPLAPYVWSYEKKELPELIHNLALSDHLTLGTVESCTGGLVASKLTDRPGISAVYRGSLVTYSNELKSSLCEVSKEILENFGAVSMECVKAMAVGGSHKLSSDVTVAISGILGPDGGTPQKPVGLVYIGVYNKKLDQFTGHQHQVPGDRQRKKDRVSDLALLALWRSMAQLKNPQ